MIEIIALALANRQRGSQTDSGVNKVLFAAVFALVALASGVSQEWAILAGISMFFAMKPSWGEQIGAFGGWSEDRDTDVLTNWLLSKLTLTQKQWGILGLITRGLYFTFPFIICQLYFSALLVPFAFAGSYMLGVTLEKQIMKRDGFVWGEYIWGGIMGCLVVGF